MVSLNAVDEMVHKACEKDGTEYAYGVVAVPHESKGEQIVLVTNNQKVTQDCLHNYIRNNGMSELYLPRVILYHDSLPVFATLCKELNVSPSYLLSDTLPDGSFGEMDVLFDLWRNATPSQLNLITAMIKGALAWMEEQKEP